MDVKGSNLLGIDLPEPIAAVVRKVEALAKQPVTTVKTRAKDAPNVFAFFDDDGSPKIVQGPGGKPSLEQVAIEVLRLELRANTREKRMPYAEMRHESNQRLCKVLYRIMEEEILYSVAGTHGIDAREEAQARMEKELLEPLKAGKYREGEDEIQRARCGTLDALELMVSYVERFEAMQAMRRIGELDEDMSRQVGFIYKVIENHRPFEGNARVRAAYYLAVPFLFDNRKPLRPTAKRS